MEEEGDVGKHIQMLSRQIKRRMDKSVSEYEITGKQGAILLYIYDESLKRDVYAKDIEVAFNMRRASVTGILQLMEKNGLIKREENLDDGRLKKLKLTTRAEEAREKLKNEIIKVEQNLTEGISKKEIETFFTIMKKMSHNLSLKEEKDEMNFKGYQKNLKEIKGKTK